MPNITSKDMNIYIKRGYGTVDISKKIGIVPEELEKLLDVAFNSATAKGYKRRIHKNDNKKKVEKTTVAETEVSLESTGKEVDSLSEMVVVANDDTVASVDTLDALKVAEREQQERTVQQEMRVNEQNRLFREKMKEVGEREQECILYQKKIDQIEEAIERLSSELEAIRVCHNEQLDLLHEEQAKLDKIRKEILEKSIVYVFVSGSDSTITAERGEKPFELQIGNWQEVRERLEQEFFELVADLSLKQIIQLAKILSLSKEEEYDFTFDKEEVEIAYITVKEKFA